MKHIHTTFSDYVKIYESTDNKYDFKKIMNGYLECALWCEEERLREDFLSMNLVEDDEEDEEDDDVDKIVKMMANIDKKPFAGFAIDDIDIDSKIKAYSDIKKFVQYAGDDAVSEAIEENGEEQLGYDIWFTRNGHGAGFFDRSYDHEKELEEAAKKLKEVDIYVGDDNKIYFGNAND